MDVSIAVSLIRGQMGAVVERAVNGAVETVLAEMLKVVGVKFEELKAQVLLMKREVAALQREKALKEKENDNIRAKLRYTELKLKYYRQGVEEELQQRASTLVYIHPHNYPRTQRGGAGAASSTETTSSCSTQNRTTGETLTRTSPECTSSQLTSRRAGGALCPSGVGHAYSSVNTPGDSVDSSSALQDDWSFSVQPHTEGVETLDDQADSSMLPPSGPEVKQEEVEEEVICIKEEEEEEEEEEAATLQPAHRPETEAQRSVTDWSRLPVNQTNPDTSVSAGLTSYPLSAASLPSVASSPAGVPPRPAVRPWTKDLSLYEEYKLRRNELRRRNLNRRRELEKTLPQPLLADLLQERREKTRLRVARWRAKRKLQACLNQAQPHGGAAGLSQLVFQHQQLRASNQSSALSPSSSFLRNMSTNSISAVLPILPSSSSSSSSHQVSLSQQSMSLTDTDL